MGEDLYTIARRKMVEGQFVPANIMDEQVVEAFSGLPRELFVEEWQRGSAYIDEHLEVAEGRYLMAPVLLARLLVLAGVKASDRVLDVGAATGYSTALLAQLAAHVVAVEESTGLGAHARQLLSRLHLPNTEVVSGGLAFGHPSGAPYDVVLINGGVQVLPQTLADQVREGGCVVGVRMVSSLPGVRFGLGKATLWRKEAGKLVPREAFDASVPLLKEFEEKREFVF